MSADVSSSSLINQIKNGAERCVACGLCLPHCPTYAETKSELESPRGRLSLMLAVAKNELAPTAKLEAHLSLCLMCRACEAVCPAQVPFAEVMDAARTSPAYRRTVSIRQRAIAAAAIALTKPAVFSFVRVFLLVLGKTGLRALLRRSGFLRLLRLDEIDRQLPHSPQRTLDEHHPAQTTKRGTVALFVGCVAKLADGTTHRDTIHVLTHLGYDVWVPRRQTCCGALSLHQGDLRRAQQLQRDNVLTFAATRIDAVITTASGCAATLVEYTGDAAAKDFAAQVVDISDFLNRAEWPASVSFRPLAKRVAVQDPCTLRNVMRATRAPYELLARIPQLEVMPLPGNNVCCGSAGSYHLQHPDMAQALRQRKITSIQTLKPDVIATSNVGCAMYLAAGLQAAGTPVELVHPVSLLASQLTTRKAP